VAQSSLSYWMTLQGGPQSHPGLANPESARVGMSLVWKASRLRGCVVAARASFIIRVSRPITHSNPMIALVENADSRSVGPFDF